MTQAAPSPIRDNVGNALRFTREHVRFILVLAVIGAAANTLLTALAATVSQLGWIAAIAATLLQAAVYAALTTLALAGPAEARAQWLVNGGRLWAAMAVVAFFLFIVFFVISIPVMMVLLLGPMAALRPDLEAAAADQAAVMAVVTRFAEQNPGVVVLVMLFYFALWYYLTSRLYLAAPATLQQKRVLTFETWQWTKGAVLQIIGARLMLLVPAAILLQALGYLAGRLVGIDTMAGTPTTVLAAALFHTFFFTFVSLALCLSLEAGLSTSFYRHLRAAEAQRADH